MARRFQSRRTTSPRRLTSWIGGNSAVPTNEVVLSGTTAVIALSFDTRVAASAPIGARFTIVRVRGLLSVKGTPISADAFAVGALGIAVVNGEAFDAGVASLISPWTESGDDRWLYHTYWSTMTKNIAQGVITSGLDSLVIDSKSMRKVNTGDVIVSVLENASSDSVQFFLNHRMLVKLA